MGRHQILERDFLAFINDNHLFSPTDRVLLAVSGGLDSMVMTELVHRIHQSFAVAHVNFGLRGAESDADARFVENRASAYGVPFHLTRFDTVALAHERGVSIQMMARDLRYDWFAQLVREHGYACVATAHHLNDVLETMLVNLTRGTGIAGLHGITSQPHAVVRPLGFTTRAQLAEFADALTLPYREDSSNAGDTYARNRIRHHVIPVLTELNPGLWQTLPHTLERLRAAEVLMRRELDRAWQEVATPQGRQILLSTYKLRTLPETAFYLAEWLRPFGFTTHQAAQMAVCLSRPVGQLFATPTHRVLHERNGLLLEPLPEPVAVEIRLADWPQTPISMGRCSTLTVTIYPKSADFQPPAATNVACLDADRLSFPLTIRPWHPGDRFRPLGLAGRKLVSDLLNDLKLSRPEREQTVVLLSGREIAWVIGQRIDHRFRVTSDTNRVACFLWRDGLTEPESD